MKFSFALCALTLCALSPVWAAPARAPLQAPLARGYTVVSGVSISFERTKYKPGETASGKVTLSGEGTDKKAVTVSGGAQPSSFSLAPGESQTISAQLSTTPGSYSFTAKSGDKESTASVQVVPKTWKANDDITGGAPKNPVVAKVGPGGAVSVEIEDATDEDEWVYDVGDEKLNESGKEADDVTTYSWFCDRGVFLVGENEDGTPNLEQYANGKSVTWLANSPALTAKLSYRIDDAPKAVGTGEAGSRDDKPLDREIAIEVLSAQLMVKRQGTNDDQYSSSARIAAGGKDSSEQKADVWVKFPNDADVAFGKVSIVKGQEEGYEGVKATLAMDGKKGVLTSHNIIGSDLTVRLEAGYGSLEATVSQIWDEVAKWEHSPYFSVDVGVPVTFTPALRSDQFDGPIIPIKNQTIGFEVTSIEVLLWSEEAHDFRLYPFAPGVPKWDIISGLVSFSPAETSSASGAYSTKLTVKSDPQRFVDTVKFDTVGLSVVEVER